LPVGWNSDFILISCCSLDMFALFEGFSCLKYEFKITY
jgi:hypothetical protein